jgi:hypothetical protein
LFVIVNLATRYAINLVSCRVGALPKFIKYRIFHNGLAAQSFKEPVAITFCAKTVWLQCDTFQHYLPPSLAFLASLRAMTCFCQAGSALAAA